VPLLAACGPLGGASPAQPAPAKGPVTLDVMDGAWVSAEDLELHRSVWRAFQQARPHVKLEVDETWSTLKVITRVAAGTPPDTANIHPNDLATAAAAGVFRELDGFIKGDRTIDIKLYHPVVLDYFRYKGKLLEFPYYSGPSMMYYNKTLLTRHGVKLPEEYERANQWSWDQGFLEACRKLTQGAGDAKTYGYGGMARALAMVAAAVWSNGGDLIDWQGHTKAYLTTPATLEVFQQQADLVLKHGVVPPPAEEPIFGGSWGLEKGFQMGRIGFLFGGRFWGPQLRPITDFEVGMWHHPKGRAGRFHRNGPNGYGVVSGAKQPEEGWEFVKFYAGPVAQALLFTGGRNVPITTRKEDLEAFRKSLMPWEREQVYLDTNKNMRALAPQPAQWGEMNNVYGKAWSEVLLGQREVKAALEDVNRQWELLMRQ
jgi:multiple sugar transport system substrate-binding protein